MYNNEEEFVIRHPIIHDLHEISKIERLEIKHVDFETGNIVVSVKEAPFPVTFDSVMQSIKFVDMIEQVALQTVDFETGRITIRWYPQGTTSVLGNLNISKEELNFLKAGKKVEAIKATRNRTGLGLVEAKNLVESVAEELRRRGLIRRN